MFKIKRQLPLIILAIVGLASAMVISIAPLSVSADSDPDADLGQQQLFDDKICTALKKIDGQKLYAQNCKSYIKQKDLDKAKNTICKAYKKQLKSPCNAYDDLGTDSLVAKNGKDADGSGGTFVLSKVKTHNSCGAGDQAIKTSIDIGCVQKGNAITDASFAIIRFLSNGVALVLIGSLIWGGIQYTTSQGDPQATAAAQGRIRSVIGALALFIFAYAILNFLIPTQLLK